MRFFQKKVTILYGIATLALLCPYRALAIDQADALFKTVQDRVYQIRVIDNTSGKKSSIGSGFAVSGNGLIATNYHVIAEMIDEPKRYHIEYTAPDGSIGPLRIADIDVVHDLAIVSSTLRGNSWFSFRTEPIQKGSRIFSMGNPLDLGQTIIEGIYNGLIEQSLYEKFLFSGSLNPGMSGGPSIDQQGRVIGVNVSTAGNEISFLVPVKYLQILLDSITARKQTDTINLTKRIEDDLYLNQERYMSLLLNTEWKSDTLGHCLIPREMDNIFKTWGETQHDTDFLYTVSSVYSVSNDNIYLSPDLTTGSIEFHYRAFATNRLDPIRFYRVLQSHAAQNDIPNFDGEKELKPPQTTTRFVTLGKERWKITMCSWQYKKYPRLNDIVLKMALVNHPHSSMLISLNLLGVSNSMAIAFCKKFIGAITWVK